MATEYARWKIRPSDNPAEAVLTIVVDGEETWMCLTRDELQQLAVAANEAAQHLIKSHRVGATGVIFSANTDTNEG